MTTETRLVRRSTWRVAAAWAAIVSLSLLPFAVPLQAQPQRQPAAPQAPTVRMIAGQVQPLTEALLGFDADARAARGKAPADATRKLNELENMARPAKAEIRSFLTRLRQAKEVDVFEATIYRLAGTSGRSTLPAEIKQLGGPVALLEKADSLFDELIAERRKATSQKGFDALLEALGLTVELSAGIRTGACGAFFFMVTLGYGTNVAYRACYY